MKKNSGGRKAYLVNPDFQLKLIGYALFIALLTIGVFYLSNLYFFWKLIEVGKNSKFSPDHPFFMFIGEQKRLMNSVFLVTALISLGTLIVAGVFLSHRIAGPIYRLKIYLNAIVADQHFRELKFRKGDFFADLAESINQTLALYQKRSPLPRAENEAEDLDA